MPTHVALLRGVNVGGHNKLAMADLRALLTDLGHGDVATYVQSGNAVFTPPEQPPEVIADAIGAAIAGRLAVTCDVVVVTADRLAEVARANPFADESDPKHLHVAFRSSPYGPDDAPAIDTALSKAAAKGSRDEAAVVAGALWLRTPDGLGRSELAVQLARTAAGPPTTMRNWATVTKLLAMLDGG